MNEALTANIVQARSKKRVSPKSNTIIKANIITYNKPEAETIAQPDDADDDDLN